MIEEVGCRHLLLGFARHHRREEIAADLNLLRTACQWADLHAPDALPVPQDGQEARRRRLNDEHGVLFGGDGTPEVMAYAPVELSTVLHLSLSSTRSLLGDALDLPHRLPRCWARLEEGDTAVWHGRAVARKTRQLTVEQVVEVDRQVAGYLGVVPFPRLERILDAAIAVADPAGAGRRSSRRRPAGSWRSAAATTTTSGRWSPGSTASTR